MSRVLRRIGFVMTIVGLSLLLSGCFLRTMYGGFGIPEGETLINLEWGTHITTCIDVPTGGTSTYVECVYYLIDLSEETWVEVTSTAELVSDYGVYGVLIDPLILQVPNDAHDVAGTFSIQHEDPQPLLITMTTSFWADAVTQVTAEPGHTFLILEFPAGAVETIAAADEPGGVRVDFKLEFGVESVRAIEVKPMSTIRIDVEQDTLYVPMLPCVTDFADIPAIEIPEVHALRNLMPQALSQLRIAIDQGRGGCDGRVYDIRPIETTPITIEATLKCFQIDAAGNLVSDRCHHATLAGQPGATSDGYRYSFADVPAPSNAPLALFPTSSSPPCQVDTLALQAQANGLQSFAQERICTTWEGERTIQSVPYVGGTWSRTDLPVASGGVERTWMWGPVAYSGFMAEPYHEAGGVETPFAWRALAAFDEPSWPGGYRLVIYLDKSRMEITHQDAVNDGLWYVTNGLLVVELTTGNLQLGDNLFEQRAPAAVNVAGDGDDPTGPTYATFGMLRDLPPLADGAVISQRVDRDGAVTDDPDLASHGVMAAHRVRVSGINHQVASVFWEYMHSSGVVYQHGDYAVEDLFIDPFYATGLPVSEAYWARVKVAETYRDVLIQCFERRCLTWTPDNPEGWQVEAGNVGQHYYIWRYGAP